MRYFKLVNRQYDSKQFFFMLCLKQKSTEHEAIILKLSSVFCIFTAFFTPRKKEKQIGTFFNKPNNLSHDLKIEKLAFDYV